jgi:hypothetical protein
VKPARMTGKTEGGGERRVEAPVTAVNAEIAEPADLHTSAGLASSA